MLKKDDKKLISEVDVYDLDEMQLEENLNIITERLALKNFD